MTHRSNRPPSDNAEMVDRLSWLWLALGAMLLPFTAWQTVLPMAGWLAPIFILRFSRTQRARVGLPVIILVSCLAQAFAWRDDFFGGPANVMTYGINITYGLLFSVAYMVDRLIAPRLTGPLQTLVFPAAITSVEFLLSLVSPIGAGGSLAYTQATNLPILQLVAVTGMWGVTFLVAWGAASINAAWEHGFSTARARTAVLPFGMVLLLTLLLGSARIALAPTDGSSVRVAALSPIADNFDPMEQGARALHPGSAAEREAARTLYTRNLDDLLARTRQAAGAGARIIGWPENAVFFLKEDEGVFVERIAQLARSEGIYLVVGVRAALHSDQWPFAENRALIVDPTGAVVSDYAKTHVCAACGDEFAAGPGIVPVVETPYGRLASIICVDADFPSTARMVGAANADILVLPVDDWRQITQYHTDLLTLRAVESGAAVLRPAVQGIARATDAQGRPLGQADYFATDDYLLLTDLPTRGVRTPYSVVGDALAYVSIAALALLTAMALLAPFIGHRRALVAPQAA